MKASAVVLFLTVGAAFGQPVSVTLDQAIQMALQHNQSLLAARTTVQQSQAQEVTANLRPNPELAAVWAYLPLYRPEEGLLTYLRDSSEFDLGLSYRSNGATSGSGVSRLPRMGRL